jgi:hypothetical protein
LRLSGFDLPIKSRIDGPKPEPPAIGLAGWSGSGKATPLAKIIPAWTVMVPVRR